MPVGLLQAAQPETNLVSRQLGNTVLAVILLLIWFPASAERIAVIGTGNVAAALGPEFAAQGHVVVYGSRDPSRANVAELVARTGNGASATTPAASVRGADIVLLAVPGAYAVDIATSLGDLTGKIVIDPTNNYVREGVPRLAADTSNGEALQAALPGARVVKAFNTLNWRQMVEPASSGGPVSIPLVGNDADAKSAVAALVAGMGLEPVDVGPIANAGHVEGMLVLWAYARLDGRPFNYYLRPMPAN